MIFWITCSWGRTSTFYLHLLPFPELILIYLWWIFCRYSRFQNNRERGDKDQRKEKQGESLIDLDDEPTTQQLSSKLGSLSKSSCCVLENNWILVCNSCISYLSPLLQYNKNTCFLGVSEPSAGVNLSSLKSIPAQQGAHVKREKEDDSEFDMFAQSRNVTYESSKSG